MVEQMLIGSLAARVHFPDFREPKDTDYITKHEMRGVDGKMCPSFDAILTKYPMEVAPATVLYTLKVSHAFWDIWWDKTLYDIRFFQSKGVPLDEEIFKLLYNDWENIHGAKKAMLNKTNEDFFKDGVTRTYVHDDIHQAVAFYDRPLYEAIKTDKSMAMTSNGMFLKLSHEDKIKLCQEEIFVTALERFIIPSDFTANSTASYKKGMKLLITSMTKGWFPKFIVENYLELAAPLKYNYVSKFKANIKNKK